MFKLVTQQPGKPDLIPCPTGYALVSGGNQCHDINECLIFDSICGRHGLCLNTGLLIRIE